VGYLPAADCGHKPRCHTIRCGKRLGCAILYLQTIDLPRQARDKHRKRLICQDRLGTNIGNVENDRCFLQANSRRRSSRWTTSFRRTTRVRKTDVICLHHFILVLYQRSVYQDRLRTNIGKVEAERRFSQVASPLTQDAGTGTRPARIEARCKKTDGSAPRCRLSRSRTAPPASTIRGRSRVRKTAFPPTFDAKHDDFTKTGSGQMKGSLNKRSVFSQSQATRRRGCQP
jgi:hypothetical protein